MFKFIDSLDDLVRLAPSLEAEPVVAVDTEFLWTSTYYPNPGVIQIATAKLNVIIDAVTINDMSCLSGLITSSQIVKILHDAPQDLRLIKRITGASPRSVFDTRTGAGFTGRSSTLSLAALLRDMCDVDLPKDQTRTDWTARPLTPAQIAYAADDVAHMLKLRELILAEAEDAGNRAYLEEEMLFADNSALYEEDPPEIAALRVKAPRALPTASRGYIHALAVWREITARSENRPRARILTDDAIVSIGAKLPRTLYDLKACSHVPRNIERYADTLLAILRNPHLPPPGTSATPRIYRAHKDEVRMLMDEKDRIGKELRIDSALIGSRADVEKLLAHAAGHTPEAPCKLLCGWRKQVFGDLALSCAHSRRSLPLFDSVAPPIPERIEPCA